MAVKNRSSTGHLLLRLLGLTGAFVAAIAGVVWHLYGSEGELGRNAMYVTLGGLGALGLTILCELPVLFRGVSSRRGAVGTIVFVQVILAIALVAGVNVFTFRHYKRYDLTWDHAFTLKPELREQLAQLRGDTEIVVVQRKLSSGFGDDSKPDRYDIAAPKKIVEKVQDLVDQFRDLGPNFRVKVLDIQDEDFDKKVKQIRDEEKEATKATGETSPLADAIEASSENSIFFKAGDKVQRLAFHDLYQIDKTASASANNGRGNLVMNFQGVEPFANKILKIEEKKPRISLAVVHPALSMASRDNLYLTMNGAKKFLESQGFVCNDIMLRKQDPDGGLSREASAETFDENRFEQIEEMLPSIEEAIAENEKSYKEAKSELQAWQTQTLAELGKKYVYLRLANGAQGRVTRDEIPEIEKQIKRKLSPKELIDIDEEDRAIEIRNNSRAVAVLGPYLDDLRKERDTLVKERAALNIDELTEKRRIADVEAKMKRMLADTDLLIIPRFTFLHLPTNQAIPNAAHKLDPAQLQAVKAFLKEGKPVLFLLGPSNERRESPPDFAGDGDDALEPMLKELGILLPKQTILYNAEVKEFTERRRSSFLSSKEFTLPPLVFNWEKGTGQVNKTTPEVKRTNPIRVSLNVLAKSIGDKLAKELQIRHARPVYVEAETNLPGTFDEAAVFLMTPSDTWNENSPFMNEKREAPRFTPPKDDDKTKGTLEEVRRGPFPIAIAIDRTLPARWFEGKETPTKARLGVVGNGGVFVGQTLNPVKEKLLLDLCNWLLGREDLLAKENETWSYPRVHLTNTEEMLWEWGTRLGLPLAFLYLGLMVWLVRRLR